MAAKHEAGVGLALGEEDFTFENEVAVFLVGDQEELLVGGEVNLVADNLHFAPVVGIVPVVDILPVEEIAPFAVAGMGVCDKGESGCE